MTEKINLENLETVTGGNDGLPSNMQWLYGTVHGVVHYYATSCLTLRNAPDGEVVYTDAGKPVGWQNGDTIECQPGSKQGSWIRARKGQFSGWTNCNYVNY